MTRRPSTLPRTAGTKISASLDVNVLELAEDREHEAPPEATRQIAAWVNEGGAGGEVKR
jgi:hypothetical protein